MWNQNGINRSMWKWATKRPTSEMRSKWYFGIGHAVILPFLAVLCIRKCTSCVSHMTNNNSENLWLFIEFHAHAFAYFECTTSVFSFEISLSQPWHLVYFIIFSIYFRSPLKLTRFWIHCIVESVIRIMTLDFNAFLTFSSYTF